MLRKDIEMQCLALHIDLNAVDIEKLQSLVDAAERTGYEDGYHAGYEKAKQLYDVYDTPEYKKFLDEQTQASVQKWCSNWDATSTGAIMLH